MNIIKQEIKTFIEKLICGSCKGEMKFSGNVLSGNPPIQIHICDSCAVVQEVKGDTYPKTSYEYVDVKKKGLEFRDYGITYTNSLGGADYKSVCVTKNALKGTIKTIKDLGGWNITVEDSATEIIIYYDSKFSDGVDDG